MDTVVTITRGQCAAARALTRVSVELLARRSGLDAQQIEQFEGGYMKPNVATLQALQLALEELGAHFIPESTMGVGVRLRFTAATSRRVSGWENEGGAVGDDDIP